ncbi:MAG: hypothetical protein K8T90_09180 [Planctomycetes bacterium]|nr:hypothetical protein [Planctomycetota bacterium]
MRRFVFASVLLACSMWPGARADQDSGAVVQDLIADLASSEAHVREQARDGLAKIGAAAVPWLSIALVADGSPPSARIEAARALARIGPVAADALPALRTSAESTDVALAAAAREAILAIEAGAPRVADVPAAIQRAPTAERPAAVRRLSLVRVEDRDAAATLLQELAAHADPAVRLAAVETLGMLDVSMLPPDRAAELAASSLLILARAMGDVSVPVRAAAASAAIARYDGKRLQALLALPGRDDDASRRARPWLVAAATERADAASTGRTLRGFALARGMRFVGGDAAAADDIAVASAEVLGAARPVLAEAVEALSAATTGELAARVRREAALALGATGDDGKGTAIDALVALLADRESRAQVEAAAALKQILLAEMERSWKPSRAPAEVQKAIDAGISWLVRHQDGSGGFDGDGFEKHDPKDGPSGGAGKEAFDDGLTALAALALARSGAVPTFGETDASGVALRRALVRLVEIQDAAGCYGARGIKHWIYTQAIGTLAMVEASRRTGGPVWRESAQRALDFLAACRNPEGSWRYDVRPKDADTSVNGWVVQALRAGERSGFRVDRSGYRAVLTYLDTATDANTGRVGYLPDSRESARTNEMLKKFPPALTTAMTSSACVQRLLLGRDVRTDAALANGLEVVRKMPPAWDAAGGRTDLYSWMAGTEALYLVGGDAWATWKKSLRDALLPSQSPAASGARAGSWDPADPWGPDGGRIYSTAAAVLCLETHQGQIPPLPHALGGEARVWRAVRALDAASKDAANHETVRAAAAAALVAISKP